MPLEYIRPGHPPITENKADCEFIKPSSFPLTENAIDSVFDALIRSNLKAAIIPPRYLKAQLLAQKQMFLTQSRSSPCVQEGPPSQPTD